MLVYQRVNGQRILKLLGPAVCKTDLSPVVVVGCQKFAISGWKNPHLHVWWKKKPSKFAIQTPSPSPKFGASSPMNSSSVPPFCSRAWFTPSNTTSSLVENEAGGLGWDQNVGILFVGEMLVLFVGGPTCHQHYFINMFCSIKSGPKNQNDYITKMCYFIIFLHHQLFIKSLKKWDLWFNKLNLRWLFLALSFPEAIQRRWKLWKLWKFIRGSMIEQLLPINMQVFNGI